MKKIFILLNFLLMCILINAQAPGQLPKPSFKQKPLNPSPKDIKNNLPQEPVLRPIAPITPGVITSPTTESPVSLLMYERSEYSGDTRRYGEVTNFTYPFLDKRSISIRIPIGKVAYITFINGDGILSTVLLSGDYPTFGQTYSDKRITAIKVVSSNYAFVNFNGFMLPIHHSDCKRVYGTVKIKLIEKMADGSFVFCPLIGTSGEPYFTNRPIENILSFVPGTPAVEYGDYVFNPDRNKRRDRGPLCCSPIPLSRLYGLQAVTDYGEYSNTFHVSDAALTEGRLFVVIEPDLTAEHKSGEFALDYSSEVKMRRPYREEIPYPPSSQTFFSTNWIEIKGNPNNNYGAASGVDYSIQKRVMILFRTDDKYWTIRYETENLQ